MLCKCKAPEADMLAGRFNCGGAYIAPCLNCNKNIKMGTENYAVMLPKREEVESMLNDFYIGILNDLVAKDHAANPMFTEKEVQSVIAKGLQFNNWAEVLKTDIKTLESRLDGFSSSMVTSELRKILSRDGTTNRLKVKR